MGSLLVCISLYIGVCLVLTGMVPFSLLSEDAPLAEAFSSKGMKFVSVLISIGAVAGLTTTLLVGLYVQSRLYLGLGRDGLLPSVFSRIHPTLHTPLHSQIWCGIVAAVLGGIFNVHSLSHILSVGTLTGYSVVAACVVALRLNDKKERESSNRWTSSWQEGVICLVIIACSGFSAGILYRFSASVIFILLSVAMAVVASAVLHFRKLFAFRLMLSLWVLGLPVLVYPLCHAYAFSSISSYLLSCIMKRG
ncbi:PREDICTED: cationic amino acid transporter 9, chloroplastic isoform X2 [Camelina sativa]|uniref:Cationic amino acid transporter 9, chloroplastic isoform X2 n=1 Tax=Camelina sativa TaxID=90675 RepID=A0ABM1QP09_CAMSA|nr:PREDICTED: cationic amino acid transporter 9, chloroplastic isoform X2 [Camelina sativa]